MAATPFLSEGFLDALKQRMADSGPRFRAPGYFGVPPGVHVPPAQIVHGCYVTKPPGAGLDSNQQAREVACGRRWARRNGNEGFRGVQHVGLTDYRAASSHCHEHRSHRADWKR